MSKKELDILDQVKQAEQATKKRVLLKGITRLKALAHQIVEAKKESELILEDCGIVDTDAKRIIDYVNSLSEVLLSEDDVKSIRDRVKASGKRVREEAQKQIEKEPAMVFGALSTGVTSGTLTTTGGSGSYPYSWGVSNTAISSDNLYQTSASDVNMVNSIAGK